MALPNGAGGYQIGDGNTSEAQLSIQSAPVAKTAAATLTAAEVANGLITYTGAVANLTLPLGTDLDAGISSAKNNSSIDFSVINIGGTNTVSVATNTGWTLVGTVTVIANVSGHFRAVRTGAATWSLYRLA